MTKIRLRFAPSPTGPLHIGGVRTALYNYLFAKKHGGSFILRIEDTDQARFVEGAEDYIHESLEWCGISAEEGPQKGGPYGPYRQSERKGIYHKYVQQLLDEDKAYYAFDTPQELEDMRERLKNSNATALTYNSLTRNSMTNSLTLSQEEVKARMDGGTEYVIRVKVPLKEEIRFQDMIRGWVKVHSSNLDDKVLMKSDGMPTYHLANIVDDHLMEISHVIRGEEWLPSAPLHVLLYQYFGWEKNMPQFAHLPLLLKPEGNGKLSKRDGDKHGFPVFPISWEAQNISGFREAGYDKGAFVNFLALLGWNPGSEREIFSLEELIEHFEVNRINKAGAKFDIEKAKWFNQQYLKNKDSEDLLSLFKEKLSSSHVLLYTKQQLLQIVDLLKERVTLIDDFIEQSKYFFETPISYDEKVVRKKWKGNVPQALEIFSKKLLAIPAVDKDSLQTSLSDAANEADLSAGAVMQCLRVSLTGQAGGPDLMETIAILGTKESSERIEKALEVVGKLKAAES